MTCTAVDRQGGTYETQQTGVAPRCLTTVLGLAHLLVPAVYSGQQSTVMSAMSLNAVFYMHV
jgi:hypothetical protein